MDMTNTPHCFAIPLDRFSIQLWKDSLSTDAQDWLRSFVERCGKIRSFREDHPLRNVMFFSTAEACVEFEKWFYSYGGRSQTIELRNAGGEVIRKEITFGHD